MLDHWIMTLLLYLIGTLLGILVGSFLLAGITFLYFSHQADPDRSPWAGVAVLVLTFYAVGIGGLLGGFIGGFLVWYSINL